MKYFILTIILFNLNNLYANTSAKILAGSIANNNILQGSLDKSSSAFDVAVIGSGYIPLFNKPNDEIVYTRKGNFGMDNDGYLYHLPSGLRVCGFSGDKKTEIKLDKYAYLKSNSNKQAILTSMTFTDQGELQAVYNDGQLNTIAQIKLAVFQIPRNLKVLDKDKFLLIGNNDVGEIEYNIPGKHPAGLLASWSLESISMDDYKQIK